MNISKFLLLFLWNILLLFLCGCSAKGPSPEFSPAEEEATFQLAPGLRIELVAAEPLVEAPVVITFDEDGRLWVVEMRGFMPNVDGEGEDEPVGRVSVLTDHDGDGRMDARTVFLDSLVLPRALTLVRGGILVAERKPLWYVQDTDGDLKADTKTLIDPEYGGSGMPEHSPNGLWRGMDNWYYNAKASFRYRFVEGEWIKDETEFRGQWGISHDDAGRLYYNYNWSQLHADLVPPNYLSRNVHHTPTTGIDHGLTIDRKVYPIRPNPAVNRGYIPGTLDEEGKLLEFTSACSPFVYRGTALPAEFKGNAFVCEPAGNLIKRNIVESDGPLLSAYNAYPGKEFLASTDERFRPVFLTTGPDGALYIADMYRGIVEHGPYMTPYLKEQTVARNLEQPIDKGRIWRIVPENWEKPEPVQLSGASSGDLVTRLSHSDGWHRDMAQRLLVEHRDTTVIPSLHALVLEGEQPLGRLHALWTLEGMGHVSPDLCFQALDDADPHVQSAALRLLEATAQEDEKVRAKLATVLSSAWENAAPEAVLQLALTAGNLDPKASIPLLADMAARHHESPLMRDAILSSLEAQEFAFLQQLLQSPDWQDSNPDKEIFFEMVATAIASKGNPEELTALLSMLNVDAEAFGWQQKAVLTGMAMQGNNRQTNPVPLASAPAIFSRSGSFDAGVQSRLSTLASMFEWPGHSAEAAGQEKENILNEKDRQQFALGRQHYLTVCAGCHGTDGAGMKRFAPPLVGSEWVLGDEKRLVLLLLHGVEGPIEVNGQQYDAPDILPVMPSHSVMEDGEIAAILTYIRNEWGHAADPIQPRTVGRIRHTSQGRVVPWSAAELQQVTAEPEGGP